MPTRTTPSGEGSPQTGTKDRLDSVHEKLDALVGDVYEHPEYQTSKVTAQLERANNKTNAACAETSEWTKRGPMNPVCWVYRAKTHRNVARAESLIKETEDTLTLTKLAVTGATCARLQDATAPGHKHAGAAAP